ncbi:MAG TPA: hypothetical protein VNJ04_11465 [Gemmatimonadaceae bacterium]|nr:hypothetical protein [Gemmatimonadaceae bacterium]
MVHDEGDDLYIRNASIAARALSLLFPDEEIDEDDVEFGVSFAWPNVPSPVALVKSYLEENGLAAPGAGAVDSAGRLPAPDVEEFAFDPKDFVFAEMLGDIIFLPRSVARKWARFEQAYWRSSTWGEFKKRAPADLYRETVEQLGEDRMPASRALDEDRDELTDADFPPSAGVLMWGYLPADVKVFVETGTNMRGEELRSIAVDRKAEALAIFERLGISCVEDAELVHAAVGFVVLP